MGGLSRKRNTNNGNFVWYDCLAKDPKAAIAFYTEVVGWKIYNRSLKVATATTRCGSAAKGRLVA